MNVQKADRGLHPAEALLATSLPRCPPAHPLLVTCPEAPLLPFIPGLNWCDSGGGGSDGHMSITSHQATKISTEVSICLVDPRDWATRWPVAEWRDLKSQVLLFLLSRTPHGWSALLLTSSTWIPLPMWQLPQISEAVSEHHGPCPIL